VNFDWPGRQQLALVPPPRDDGELRLCRTRAPRQLVAVAPSGFVGQARPPATPRRGPFPAVDFMAAIWREPDVFHGDAQELPFGRVELAGATALRYTLDRDVDDFAFLRWLRGAIVRVQPINCD
jgi:hypothetical protein